MKTLENYLDEFTSPDLRSLIQEAEVYRLSGVSPMDSLIRSLSEKYYHDSTLKGLEITTVCNKVYREAALRFLFT